MIGCSSGSDWSAIDVIIIITIIIIIIKNGSSASYSSFIHHTIS